MVSTSIVLTEVLDAVAAGCMHVFSPETVLTRTEPRSVCFRGPSAARGHIGPALVLVKVPPEVELRLESATGGVLCASRDALVNNLSTQVLAKYVRGSSRRSALVVTVSADFLDNIEGTK